MDSQHRHELEQNDLEAFLANFGQWWQKHGTLTLIIVLGVSIAVVGYVWFKRSNAEAVNAAWADIEKTNDPANLGKVAAEHDVPIVAALAHLRAGDAFLKKALTKPDTKAQQADLDAAAKSYQTVIDGSAYPIEVKLNAMLGKASILESRRKFTEAEALYKDVIGKSEKVSAVKGIAEARLENLKTLGEPVVFVPDPKPLNPLVNPGEGGGSDPLTPPPPLNLDPSAPGALPLPGLGPSLLDPPGAKDPDSADSPFAPLDPTAPAGDKKDAGDANAPAPTGDSKADGE